MQAASRLLQAFALSLLLPAWTMAGPVDAAELARQMADRQTAGAAITTLRALPEDEAVRVITAILGTGQESTVRRRCVYFLNGLQASAAQDAMAAQVGDKDPAVRHACVMALVERHDPRALPALSGWIEAGNDGQEAEAVRLLVGFGEPGFAVLLEHLRQGDPKVVRRVLAGLREITVRARRLGPLADRDGLFPPGILPALDKVLVTQALPLLLALTRDAADAEVRDLALVVLATVPDPAAAEAVRRALAGMGAAAGVRAAELLPLVTHPAKAEWLRHFLGNADAQTAGPLASALLGEVRLAALDAILAAARRLGPPAAGDDTERSLLLRYTEHSPSLWDLLALISDPRLAELARQWVTEQGHCSLPVARILFAQADANSLRQLLSFPFERARFGSFDEAGGIGRRGVAVVPLLRELLAAPGTSGPVRRDALLALTATGDESAYALLLAAADAPVVEDRQVAAQGLDLYWDIRTVPVLLRLAKDPDAQVREAALSALSGFHEPGMAPTLVAVYPALVAGSWSPRADILKALVWSDEDGVRDLMLAALADPEQFVRGEALHWRGWTRQPPPLQRLMPSLADVDHQPEVEKLLAAFPAEAVIPALADRLRTGDTMSKGAAAGWLSVHLPEPRASAALFAGLRDADAQVRQTCARVLATRGDPQIVARLLEELPRVTLPPEVLADIRRNARRPRDPLLAQINSLQEAAAADRREMVGALVSNADPRATAAIIGLLADADAGVRRRAACALGQRGDARALTEVLAALRDGAEGYYAGQAVLKLRTPELVNALLAALERAPTTALLNAAGELGDPRAIPALLRVVEQGPPRGEALGGTTWSAAVLALGKIGSVAASDLLGRELEEVLTWRLGQTLGMGNCDGAYNVLVEALGATHDRRVTPLLLRALYDPVVDPRRTAEALGELGDPRAVGPLFDVACQPPCLLFAGCWALPATCGVAVGKIVRQAPELRASIVQHLDSGNWRQRACAVQACGELADEAAQAAVTAALSDPQPDVRAAAADAAGRLQLRTAEPALRRLEADDPYWFVRRPASDGLTRLAGREPEHWW